MFNVEDNGITFWLKVKPRSSKERLIFDSSHELRLEVHASPTEGEANRACIQFLARALRLPQSSVAIVSGEKSRRKLIRIDTRSGPEISATISRLAGQ